MRTSQYIIVKKTGRFSYGTRMTKSSPALAPNEIAVKVVLEIPDAIFEKPTLEANIVVPETAVNKPVITAETIDNVEQIIKQNTGFSVTLAVVEQDEK